MINEAAPIMLRECIRVAKDTRALARRHATEPELDAMNEIILALEAIRIPGCAE